MSSPPSSLTNGGTKRSHDQQIRARLLGKLGIYDGSSSNPLSQQQPMTAAQQRRLRILRGMGVGHMVSPSPPDGSAVRPPLDGVMPFQEPLKAGDEHRRASRGGSGHGASGITSAAPVLPEKLRSCRIMFQDEVQVLPIPTRYEYSDRIKSRIWSNRHELQENAERNAVEFAAEGWDWRQVTEDDGMFICSVSGELVHPIHLQHLMQDEDDAVADAAALADSSSAPPHGALERGTPVHTL